jgi:predicted RNA-binding Zn ribbon-like protein
VEFLNALARPGAEPPTSAEAADQLLAWLEEMGLVPKAALDALRSTVVPGELDAVAFQARALAGWFRGFVDRYKGAQLLATAVAELQPINRILERDLRYGQIAVRDTGDAHGESGLVWRSQRQWRSPENLLLPIAEAMADLVCSADFALIRECEGNGCHRLFLDRTRGRGRRWCSMAVCGNRAKQATRRGLLNDSK